MRRLAEARGPLTDLLFEVLRGTPADYRPELPSVASDAPLSDEDLKLAQYCV